MHEPTENNPADTPTHTANSGSPEPGAGDAMGGSVDVHKRPVPAWHLHRRLYDWVLSLAHHRHATTSLFALSFAESSFFPIPPDVLQIALTIERRDKAWWFAGVSTIGSVLGGMAGYLIGMWGWEALGPFFFEHVPGFTHEHFDYVQGKYEAFALLTILTAAFTPIPYKVFTITAGVFGVPWWALIVGSLVGRAGRFYLVGAIIWKFGEPAKRFVDRYFNWLTLAFVALVVAGVLVIKASSNGHDSAPESSSGGVASLRPPAMDEDAVGVQWRVRRTAWSGLLARAAESHSDPEKYPWVSTSPERKLGIKNGRYSQGKTTLCSRTGLVKTHTNLS